MHSMTSYYGGPFSIGAQPAPIRDESCSSNALTPPRQQTYLEECNLCMHLQIELSMTPAHAVEYVPYAVACVIQHA